MCIRDSIDPLLAVRIEIHAAELLEQAVELGAVIVRHVLALVLHLAVLAVVLEQEGFRVRIVGIPAPERELGIALAVFLLETVPLRQARHELYVDALELLDQQLEPGAIEAVIAIKIDQQRFAGFGICLLYTSPSPRDRTRSRMPSSACK